MRIPALLLLILLAACEHRPGPNEFTLVPPSTPAGRTCAALCVPANQSCDNICEANFNTCKVNLRRQSQQNHQRYVQGRLAHGLLVKKTEADFWSEAVAQGCPAIAPCHERCEVSMRYCHSKCGGEVRRGDNCFANCDKKTNPYDDEPEEDKDSWL
jgi:hypothetical protein